MNKSLSPVKNDTINLTINIIDTIEVRYTKKFKNAIIISAALFSQYTISHQSIPLVDDSKRHKTHLDYRIK